MMAATKIPVPVADSQLSAKTAASGRASGTTGGVRSTMLCSSRTGNRRIEMPSRSAFICGNPQTKTTMLRMIQGTHA